MIISNFTYENTEVEDAEINCPQECKNQGEIAYFQAIKINAQKHVLMET